MSRNCEICQQQLSDIGVNQPIKTDYHWFQNLFWVSCVPIFSDINSGKLTRHIILSFCHVFQITYIWQQHNETSFGVPSLYIDFNKVHNRCHHLVDIFSHGGDRFKCSPIQISVSKQDNYCPVFRFCAIFYDSELILYRQQSLLSVCGSLIYSFHLKFVYFVPPFPRWVLPVSSIVKRQHQHDISVYIYFHRSRSGLTLIMHWYYWPLKAL